MYNTHGARLHRELFFAALRRIYKRQVLTTSLPSAGRVSLLHQRGRHRYVVHLLYSPPLQRGRCLVIEDFPPIFEVPIELRVPEKIRRITLPLEKKQLKAKGKGGAVSVVVPKVEGHQVVVFEY